jgi:hypothetical protein
MKCLRIYADLGGESHFALIQYSFSPISDQEFETSDGQIRRLGPGTAVLAEDTRGKGHNTRHPTGEQQVILIPLPDGM